MALHFDPGAFLGAKQLELQREKNQQDQSQKFLGNLGDISSRLQQNSQFQRQQAIRDAEASRSQYEFGQQNLPMDIAARQPVPGFQDLMASNSLSQKNPNPSNLPQMNQSQQNMEGMNQQMGQPQLQRPLLGGPQTPQNDQGSSVLDELDQKMPHLSRRQLAEQIGQQTMRLKNQETQADISFKESQTKKNLHEANAPYSLDEKATKESNKRWDQIVKDTDPYKASSRSALGIAIIGNQRANRAIPVLQNSNATNQDINTAIADISGIFQGGVPTESGIHAQEYQTLIGKFNDLKTYITGEPSAPALPEIKKHLLELVNTLKQVNNATIKDQLDYVETAHPDLIQKNLAAWTGLRKRIGVDQPQNQGDQGPQIITQRNKRTGQIRTSSDGGNTWQIQQ